MRCSSSSALVVLVTVMWSGWEVNAFIGPRMCRASVRNVCRDTARARLVPVMATTEGGANAVARRGDVVKLDLEVLLKDGKPLEATFDQGEVRFLLGGGGWLPAIHSAVEGMEVGQRKEVALEPEEAYGPYYDQLVAEVPLQNGPPGIKVGDKVKLANGMNAFVTAVNTDADTITIDANRPNAGESLHLKLDLKAVDPIEKVERAHFAAGCFWGLELAFQRVAGVVATSVGYTQGQKEEPTYTEVCSGATGHAEAVEVVYDPDVVSFDVLLEVFWGRHDPTQLNRQGNDVGTQYRGGVYYFTDEQRKAAEASKRELEVSGRYERPIVTEILPAVRYWRAEDYHQQYLEKGGQDAEKESRDTIRCYG